jgi:MSHA biogenesis protein MshL
MSMPSSLLPLASALALAALLSLVAPAPAALAAQPAGPARPAAWRAQFDTAPRASDEPHTPTARPLAAAAPEARVAVAAPPALAAQGVATPGAPAPRLAATAPPPPAAAAEPRFDLAVNNAPAAQVFMQLGHGTPYNVLVAPEVSGQISIALKNTTVVEALESLRELFGYDFRVAGQRIFVYPNTVQTRLYRVNYLPGRRQGASDIRVTSSAISQSGAGGSTPSTSSVSGGAVGGSGSRPDDSAHVRTTSDADFWREVQASLAALVGGKEGRSVVLNIAAGVIVIKATPSELRQVEQYLKAVQVAIERQVMLEAKIVEVQLSKDAQTGINWSGFARMFGNTAVTVGMAAPGASVGTTGALSSGDGNSVGANRTLGTGALGRGFYGLAFQSANFGALLNFLQTQGEVSVLSSPRIATLNNQKAVLKVGSDELYVTGVTTSTTTSGNSSVSTPSLTLQPFFSGIALDVTPQIDDQGMVMLHVHPAVSSVSEKTKNVDLGSLGAYKLPLAASTVNETDSIVRVRDGQIVAIGGLMKQELRDEKTGLPVVSDVPVVGGLFRQTSQVMSKRELVILLKPTVIAEGAAWPDGPTVSQAEPR